MVAAFAVAASAAETAANATKTLTLPGGATMELIYVSPGAFTMGSPSSEAGRFNDETQHQVTLTKGFWLGKYEVTQRQWRSVMGNNSSRFKGEDRPVETVSWDDCQKFIQKVNARLKCGARLPTEAEWEYACRAGTTTAYSWGNALNGDKANCNGHFPCGTTVKGPCNEQTTSVGGYAPNAWGFYDMHGNVFEWCDDWYGDYPAGSATDPTGPASGDFRVLRGGCRCYDARSCRSAYRYGRDPDLRTGLHGFRLCCAAEKPPAHMVGSRVPRDRGRAGRASLPVYASHDTWVDVDGHRISAHDGGISRFNGTFYWYGTSYVNNPKGLCGSQGRKLANGIRVYTSTDLRHWKSEGVCLQVPKTGPCSTGSIHRANVIYNDKTKKYVMWFFHFTQYPDAMLAVATADRPTGPFRILGNRKSGEDNGLGQDLGLFKDDDGKAYMVCDEGHRNLRVDLLSDDYLEVSGKDVVAIKAPPACEGAAMIKYGGKYIVAGSGVRGWACTDSYYAVADHPLGPYSSPRLLNPKGNLTWGSQISNFFTDGKTVYALCDRMFIGDDGRRVKDLEASSYYFLPLQLDPATGEARLLFGGLSP